MPSPLLFSTSTERFLSAFADTSTFSFAFSVASFATVTDASVFASAQPRSIAIGRSSTLPCRWRSMALLPSAEIARSFSAVSTLFPWISTFEETSAMPTLIPTPRAPPVSLPISDSAFEEIVRSSAAVSFESLTVTRESAPVFTTDARLPTCSPKVSWSSPRMPSSSAPVLYASAEPTLPLTFVSAEIATFCPLMVAFEISTEASALLPMRFPPFRSALAMTDVSPPAASMYAWSMTIAPFVSKGFATEDAPTAASAMSP